MNWSKRGAKILGSFVTGYSGGLGTLLTLGVIDDHVTFTILFTIPCVTGLVTALPQLGKILQEIGMDDGS
jgi:hypothetical protein